MVSDIIIVVNIVMVINKIMSRWISKIVVIERLVCCLD